MRPNRRRDSSYWRLRRRFNRMNRFPFPFHSRNFQIKRVETARQFFDSVFRLIDPTKKP
jgi:hypothetical protein